MHATEPPSTTGRLRSLRWGFVAVAIAVAGVTTTTSAGDAIPLNTTPIAVRGGILGLPLRLPAAGEGLPAEVRLSIQDGPNTRAEVLGRVVYLATPVEWTEPHWTRSANPTVVRALPEGRDPRTLLEEPGAMRMRSVDAALLLADLPELSSGATIRIGGTTITPSWIDPGPVLASIDAAGLIDPELVASWRDDRPDPLSPFEWFRWTLIAPKRSERLPAPPGDAGSQLFARHVAELWLAGIERIERQSKGVADSVRDWLTATVQWVDVGRGPAAERGDGTGLAMWIADPGELSSLLAILLDRSRDDEAVMNATLAWMDARTPMAIWIESDVAGVVTIALANPLVEELVVKMQWLGETLPPLATLIPFRAADRVRLQRPLDRLGSASAGEPMILSLEAGTVSKRLAFAPRTVQARPPTLSFGAFLPALTLADVQASRVGAVSPEWATAATLRRRDGHWEVFAECMTPRPNSSSETAADSLTIEIHGHSLSVRRDGTLDGDTDAIADVGVRNYPGRWRARITLPDVWMPKPGSVGAVVSMGLRRDSPAVHTTAVLARTAFATETPRVEIDVSAWNEGITPR